MDSLLDRFNTPLSVPQEARYQDWLATQKARSGRDYSQDTKDYDLRGWWLKNAGSNTPSGHFTDEFKKPNHPTFSDESKYSGVVENGQKYQGGTWSNVQGKDIYTPSSEMLRNTHGLSELMSYMDKSEPNAILNMDRRANPSKSLADYLRPVGIQNSRGGQDSIPAFINPHEANLLQMMGGSGRTDPQTGMLHFDDGGDGGDGESNGGGDDNSTGTGGGEEGGNADTGGGDNSYSDDSGDNSVWQDQQDQQAAISAAQQNATSTQDAYNEVTGDLGTSGRGGNVGGITGPSGGLGVGGFGSPAGAANEVDNYGSDPNGWNNTNNNFAGLDGPVDADTFANWASRNGILSQVGAGQKGVVDDAKSFVDDHPGLMNTIGLGLSIANPFAGALYNATYGLSQGRGGGLGSMLGGLSGVPGGAAIGGALGNVATGNWQGALSGALGYGLGSTGNSLGQMGYSMGGPLGGYLGSQAQGYGLGALSNAVANADYSGPNAATQSNDDGGNGLASNDYGPGGIGGSGGMASTGAPSAGLSSMLSPPAASARIATTPSGTPSMLIGGLSGGWIPTAVSALPSTSSAVGRDQYAGVSKSVYSAPRRLSDMMNTGEQYAN